MLEIRQMLRTAREKLGLDIAFVSQFVEDQRLFRYVDATEGNVRVRDGAGNPLDETCCQRIVDGCLPGLISDSPATAVASALPATGSLSVGSHVSVPVRLSDGTIFGTLCCFSHEPRTTLNARDLAMVRTFADITARRLEQGLIAEQRQAEKERRIKALIGSAGPEVVYQPIFMLNDLRIAGAEALSRFPADPDRPADVWFKEAAEVGLQVELELLAIRNALRGYRKVWRKHRIQLGLNASAATIADRRLTQILEGYPRELIVIELTEHEEVRNYATLLETTRALRSHGTKIAVDDVGAGYASMRHVLTLRPNILKLDVGLIRSIDADDLKVALISSLQHFADQFACRVVAEGVETERELAVLRRVGVQAVQGYLLGRPGSPDALLAYLALQAGSAWRTEADVALAGTKGVRRGPRPPSAVRQPT